MSRTAFYEELFSLTETERKITINKPFIIISELPLSASTTEINNMIDKIVSLCGSKMSETQNIVITGGHEIMQLIQHQQVEVLLCFVSKPVTESLHIVPNSTQFVEHANTNMIFLPPFDEFSKSKEAKKNLWRAMKKTFNPDS